MKKEIVFETFAIKRSRVTSRIWSAERGPRAQQHNFYPDPAGCSTAMGKAKGQSALHKEYFPIYSPSQNEFYFFARQPYGMDSYGYWYPFEVSL